MEVYNISSLIYVIVGTWNVCLNVSGLETQ